MTSTTSTPYLARKDLFVPERISSFSPILKRFQIVDAGNNRVQVNVTDFSNLDNFLGSLPGYRDEYCPNIMCGAIRADPTHELIISRLKAMESDFDDKTISLARPGITGITNRANIPALYTILYLSYLYRNKKASSCPTSGLPRPAEQCASYRKSGVIGYKQYYGGGRRSTRRSRSRRRQSSSKRGRGGRTRK